VSTLRTFGIFVAVWGLALGLLATTASAGAGPSLRVDSVEGGLDSEVKVDLVAHDFNEPGLGAWTVDVYYNAEVVTLLECEASHGGLCNDEYDHDAARVAGVSAFGLVGDTELASLVFACKKEGSSELELKVDVLADGTIGDPQEVDAGLVDGKITCSEEHEKQKPGDADCDGDLSAIDASLILQYGAELLDKLPCADAADKNGDGHVNAVDAAIVLQEVAGLL
jgi:hypothetical protein